MLGKKIKMKPVLIAIYLMSENTKMKQGQENPNGGFKRQWVMAITRQTTTALHS